MDEEALTVLLVEDSLKDLKSCQLSQNFLNTISIQEIFDNPSLDTPSILNFKTKKIASYEYYF
jgi:hypothetical protein